jgi:hypothetical protein
MRILLLLFIPCICLGSCSVPEILENIRPNAQWTISNNDSTTLVWNSTQTIPSTLEIQTAVNTCKADNLDIKNQIKNDIFNLQLSTNTIVQKLPALLDLLKQRGLLQ